jgi:AhpD family alkylhydroperoxidase
MEPSAVATLSEFKTHKPKLNQEMPEVMKHLDGLFQTSLAEGALSLKEKELIVAGIAVVMRCDACIVVHLKKALAAGATRAEILEACGVAVAMGGGSVMACVPVVVKFLEETRR